MKTTQHSKKKKEYHTPEFKTYGNIHELTEAGTGNNTDDAYVMGDYQKTS